MSYRFLTAPRAALAQPCALGRRRPDRIGFVDVGFRLTSHQVARGSRPDAVKDGRWYMIKNVPLMRLTYQVKLLTFLAAKDSARLVIILPADAALSADLRSFANQNNVQIGRAAS